MISYCPKCGKPIADESAAFCPSCGASLRAAQPAQPAQPSQPTNRFVNNAPQAPGPKPDNHLVLAIVTTLLCCMPLGVWAIVLASKVDSLWATGHYAEAQENADKAKKVSIIGLIVGGIFSIIYVILTVAGTLAEM